MSSVPAFALSEAQVQLLMAHKRCLDSNKEMYRLDLLQCNREWKLKGKINRGQLEKEYRECSDSADVKSEKRLYECQRQYDQIVRMINS